jgi:hypothetical protein
MEDFEIRQAFEVIKERVTEIKKDDDWKVKIAQEWNEAHKPTDQPAPDAQDPDTQSVFSYSK